MVLHGNGGSCGQHADAGFRRRIVRSRPAARCDEISTSFIPDALGHGKSAKPSDGLKTKFPRYNYADMVDAQYRLLSEGLGIRHVRVIIGNSMGGMRPGSGDRNIRNYMDALVPMASQPTAMASRNWMLQRMMLEIVRNDPDYQQRQLRHPAAAPEDCQRLFRHRRHRRDAELPKPGVNA